MSPIYVGKPTALHNRVLLSEKMERFCTLVMLLQHKTKTGRPFDLVFFFLLQSAPESSPQYFNLEYRFLMLSIWIKTLNFDLYPETKPN